MNINECLRYILCFTVMSFILGLCMREIGSRFHKIWGFIKEYLKAKEEMTKENKKLEFISKVQIAINQSYWGTVVRQIQSSIDDHGDRFRKVEDKLEELYTLYKTSDTEIANIKERLYRLDKANKVLDQWCKQQEHNKNITRRKQLKS